MKSMHPHNEETESNSNRNPSGNQTERSEHQIASRSTELKFPQPEEQQTRSHDDHPKGRDWYDAASIIFQGLGLLLLAFYTTLTYFMWRETKKAADATKVSAEAATEAVKSGNESFSQTLDEMQAQSKAMQDMADAATKSASVAESALRTTGAQFKIDERPYMVKETMRILKKPAIGETLAGEIIWKNTGKTPAIEGRMFKAIGTLSGEPRNPETWAKAAAKATSRVEIGAGSTRSATVTTNEKFDQSSINDVQSGKRAIYVFGAIVYKDVFGDQHESFACGKYKPGSDSELFLWACNGDGTNTVK